MLSLYDLPTRVYQCSQLSRIARESHAFHTELTLTRIASFISRRTRDPSLVPRRFSAGNERNGLTVSATTCAPEFHTERVNFMLTT